MNPKWEILYEQMLADIDHREKMALPETECVESCYRVALHYWHELEKLFQSRKMQVDVEEIEFFKEVKPHFTSHIEYYLILNQVLLFIPNDDLEKRTYWNEEGGRYQRYRKRHDIFVQYYESGSIDRDADYFLQRNNRLETPSHEKIYGDADCRSSHDHIVRGLLANRMYHDYVQGRIKLLSEDEVEIKSSE
jgi:hypothetical protein